MQSVGTVSLVGKAVVVYGYLRSTNGQKTILIVDEDVSPVVAGYIRWKNEGL
jgi:hypothetical protein